MRRTLAAGMLAATLALSAGAPQADDTVDVLEPLLMLNAAVLDWCEEQAGAFHLPDITAPSCETGGVLYLGTLIGVFGEAGAPDAAWWWELRTGLSSLDPEIGVAWFVSHADPEGVCESTEGLFCQCPAALDALDNPARVPVVLIGPGSAVCEAGR